MGEESWGKSRGKIQHDILHIHTLKVGCTDMLKYLYTNYGVQICHDHKCLSWLFLIHLNTYVMGPRPL